MSPFDDWSDDNGYGGGFGDDSGQSGDTSGGFGAASDQSDGQDDNPYFQVKTDGPYAGWSNYALDNLKGSLSPMDFGTFLQDRIDTFGGNRMIQDPSDPPSRFKFDYNPADYGAPQAGQADNTGQRGGSDTDAADTGGSGSGGSVYGGFDAGGRFTNQGLYPNQPPMLGAGYGGQAADWTNPNNMPGGYGGRGTGRPNPYNPRGGYDGQPGGWTNSHDAMGGNGDPGLGTPVADPYDPSHLDQLIPILTEPLPSGIGFPVPGGFPNQPPMLGSAPGSGGLAGGGTNPYNTLGGQGCRTSPYDSMAGLGGQGQGGSVPVDRIAKGAESGNNPNAYGNDEAGGPSYGPYQISTNTGKLDDFCNKYPK